MNECPACETAAIEVQMANVMRKSMHEEMERLKQENAALRSAHAKDVARLSADRDGWKTKAMLMIVDKGDQHE